VRLTDGQQERYARHILLDGIGGDGQEKLLSSRVRVRGTGSAAQACASYLAASGIGALLVDSALARELCSLSPDLRLLRDDEDVDLELSPADPPGAGPASAAAAGCWIAVEAVRVLAGRP
jgi:molybdopterin/thiamine biosynthesis adenylyltransferase